jgi:hypothetical protein
VVTYFGKRAEKVEGEEVCRKREIGERSTREEGTSSLKNREKRKKKVGEYE